MIGRLLLAAVSILVCAVVCAVRAGGARGVA